MSHAGPPVRSRVIRTLVVVGGLATLLAGYAVVLSSTDVDVPTALVSRGALIEVLELRGEIRPVQSVVVTAPAHSGQPQIVELISTGASVEKGDVIVQFDDTVLRRTVRDKESELEQAEAEIEQARAQGRIQEEANRTALLTAQYDVERARLGLVTGDFVARLDVERAELDLADAEQHVRSAELKVEAGRTATQADVQSRERHRDKVADDLARDRAALAATVVRAPVAGTIHILLNPRSSGTLGVTQALREGDSVWPGAPIAELPDLTQVLLEARLDEGDRGRLRHGQPATVSVDAVPDRDFAAEVANMSLLAKLDLSAGFPPKRNFDLTLTLNDPEVRLRPGMSATARIEVDRLDDAIKIPPAALFNVGDQTAVYRLSGSVFELTPVEIARRTREEVAILIGVSVGDRVATAEPPPAMVTTP